MEILIAYFGVTIENNPHYFNVTSRVKQDVCKDVLNKNYSLDDLGDPCPGTKKKLTIVYSKCGVINVLSIDEIKGPNRGNIPVNIS